jgi:ATP-dependent helicase/nuclease subunit A
MARRLTPFAPLGGDQLRASHPRDHAALSASAGTGKTHVLTARVLRLLLAGADPASILCLTFTKAGAAEMAERIHARLAQWVRLKDAELGAELGALSEDTGPDMRARARTLFARVLDATGGGLRIQTIHAFAQSLLGAFPVEAGLTPGFRPLEGREEQLLARSTLADLLVRAEAGGDLGLIADLQALSLRMGEGGAEGFVKTCARAPEVMATLGPREGIEARLRHIFDLPLGDIEEAIAAACADEAFDMAIIRKIADLNAQWGAGNGLKRADACARWLAAGPSERADQLQLLHGVWAKNKGQEIRLFTKGQAPQDPDYAVLAQQAFDWCAGLLSLRARAAMVAALAAGLRAGQAFAGAYAEAKRAVGAVDFDDLIRGAEELLTTPGMGEWVRYKLDQRTDHILVDEAQDTNARQWRIVEALVAEFFAGEGARGRLRTLFTVGDFKQAIFGFQGTNPREFERARAYFQTKARLLREAAEEAGLPERELPPDFLDLSMDMNFRSSPEILRLTDQVIADLGHEAFGLAKRPNPHESRHRGRPGSVTLWAPYTVEGDEELGEEGWVSEATRAYAGKLARQVKAWLDAPFHLESRKRPLRAEDILILVRRRGDLAALLVARLHAEGVPVAGVDRLLLSAPLAVRDLLAAARFAVQPLDDLNLASFLLSPLMGWTQEDLLAVAAERNGEALWPRLRRHAATPPHSLTALHDILAMADFASTHNFFETLLSGPLDGRRKLLERLGAEARDPIEELLSAALEFEGKGASLQTFLEWFARGDVEIVRDPSGPQGAVRVMTVHGSKGLQSPVLILADACADPNRQGAGIGLTELTLEEGGPAIPVFRPRKDELAEPLAAQIAAQDAREREEHWRLLYVALTRAEERLYVGGALTLRDRQGAPSDSWHRAVENALTGLGEDWKESARWGREMTFGPAPVPRTADLPSRAAVPTLPDWARGPAPAEARPPRPLAPSSTGPDDAADPPPGPELRAAAERGRLLHRLFERLPGVVPEHRRARADIWLADAVGIADPASRAALIDDACRVIEDPGFADLFSPEALAEAPVAAIIADGRVVAGTADRLLVTDEEVLVADFKTGRRAPTRVADIPPAHLRQMAAYRAALRIVFPDRPIRAALLYTSGPTLHALDDALLDAHAPRGG